MLKKMLTSMHYLILLGFVAGMTALCGKIALRRQKTGREQRIKMLKQFMTLALSAMMIFTSATPVFAEDSSSSETAANAETLNIDDNRREDASAVSEAAGDISENPFASMTITPEEGCEAFPVLFGCDYNKDRFASVKWADYIDSEKSDADKFYREYLSLLDEKVSEEERNKTADELTVFVEEQIEDADKSPELENLDELPLGIYYVRGEGLQPALTELTEAKEYIVRLESEEAESGFEVKDEEVPKAEVPVKSAPKKAPSKRGDYLAALTDRSNDIGVPSEGYEDSPYTVDRDVWAGTSLNARATNNERTTGGTFWLDKGITDNNFTNDQYWDGKAPFRITPKNGDATTGFTFYNYNDFALEDDASVVPNAALKLDHLTLYSGGFYKHNFYARGNKLVMGEGITTAETTGSITPHVVDWRIYGGTEHNADLTDVGRPDLDTNVVVAGGHWNYIFGGGEGRTGRGTQVTVRGDANADHVYGGGERKGSVGYNENVGGGNGTNVYIEGGNVGTVYAGNGVDDRGLNINGGAHLDISGGTVGKVYGCTDLTSSSFTANSSNFGDTYIYGRSETKISGGTVGSIGGDMSRNINLGLKRQVRGATTLEVSSDQDFEYYDMFDSITVKGSGTANSASVSSDSKPGMSFTDSDYSHYRGPDFQGYIGQMRALNGGRIVIDNGAAINITKEEDLVLKASTYDTEYYLSHAWVGETSEARRNLSTLAVNGQTSGITAAGPDTFDDNSDKCGLRIYGNVQGDYDDASGYGADTAGYSTLEVLGDPLYSDDTDYYYYVVADSSANGGVAFKGPEDAEYIVCYRYLEGGKIGWYLRERPEITANNRLVHTGDNAGIKAHVELNGLKYEWSASQADCHVKITTRRTAGSESEGTAADITLSASVLAGLVSDERFTNITYDDTMPVSFDVMLDDGNAADSAYYTMSVDYIYDDDREGDRTDCALCVYDFTNNGDSSDADYQDSIMETYPYGTGAAGADKAKLCILLPYGHTAESLTISEDNGSFAMTKEGSLTSVSASLDSVSTIEADFTSASASEADTKYGVTIGGEDLSSGVTQSGLSAVNSYDCVVYSYQAVDMRAISNVHPSVVERDGADGIDGNAGEVASLEGLVLTITLAGLTRSTGGTAEPVGTGSAVAENKGELRIRAVPTSLPIPTGVKKTGLGIFLICAMFAALMGIMKKTATEKMEKGEDAC